MYKKVFLITFIMILLSISIVYCISEEYLTPKEEKGLWGFSDPNGVFVIDPKWKTVEDFRNGTAFVSFYDYDDEGSAKQSHFQDGIIGINGQYLINPEYSIDCFSYIYRLVAEKNDNTLFGYFDIESGFFVLPQYEGLRDDFPYYLHRPKDQLIGIELDDKWGFIDRETSQMVINPQYDDIPSTFCHGYALVAQYNEEVHDYEKYLINKNNDIFPLEEGYFPYSGISKNGNFIIGEQIHDADGSVYFGLASIYGEIVIEPQYEYMDWISGEVLEVYTSDEELLYIDEIGNVISIEE